MIFYSQGSAQTTTALGLHAQMIQIFKNDRYEEIYF